MLILCTLANTKIQHYFEKLLFYGLFQKVGNFSYSLPEWKLCHIEPVGFNSNKPIEELEIKDIQEHFRKYANPNNMFVLPKEIGYLGEIQIFIDEQKALI